jgi:hypothetical protein
MFQFSDPALSTAALERVGFKVIMSEEIPITYRGQNAEGVFEWYEKIAVVAWPSSVYKLLRSNSAFGTQLSMEHAHILPAVASQFPAQR